MLLYLYGLPALAVLLYLGGLATLTLLVYPEVRTGEGERYLSCLGELSLVRAGGGGEGEWRRCWLSYLKTGGSGVPEGLHADAQ